MSVREDRRARIPVIQERDSRLRAEAVALQLTGEIPRVGLGHPYHAVAQDPPRRDVAPNHHGVRAGAISVRVKSEIVRFEPWTDAPQHGVQLDESAVAVDTDAAGEPAETGGVRIEV